MEAVFLNVGIIVAILLFLMATGTWLAFALYAVSIIALMFLGRGGMQGVLEGVLLNSIDSYTLVAIPLFIFMGEIIIMSGCSDSLFGGVKKILGPLPGGLLHANILSCSIFAACSGSSTATTVAVGGVAYPELRKLGYAKRITLGSICAGGTLGVLIPPSIMMILYGAMTNNSVGKLFIAGLIPGIVLAGMFMLYMAMACILKPGLAPQRSKFVGWAQYVKDFGAGLRNIWPIIVLIGGIMISIYGGFATPTESAAVAIIIAMIEWKFLYRTMTWELFVKAVEETVIITGQLMIGIISARALGMALSLLDIPRSLSIYVSELPMSPYVVWAFIVLIYMVLGCLVDGIDLLIISIPVFYPIMTSGLGFDPIWFGVTITVLMELSLITPPVGFNIFITHSISGESNMMETIKGAFPFVIIMLLFIMIVTIFPGLATYLPGRM